VDLDSVAAGITVSQTAIHLQRPLIEFGGILQIHFPSTVCHNRLRLFDVFRFARGEVEFTARSLPEVPPMTIDIAALRELPVADKLRVVTELWDDIAQSDEAILVPEDVLGEAARRSDELRADPSIAIDDKELWRQVDA
jgi:hypothetical protein